MKTRKDEQDIIDQARPQLAERGWTIKGAWIDDGHELAGVRLTRAEELLQTSKSIQIFDRETVTIQSDFNNDQRGAITLTKDDGRQFLEWLRNEEPKILPAELWEIIPEAAKVAEMPRPAESPVTNMAKSDLVNYLVQSQPHIFGKYGSMSAGGQDFYRALLNYIQDPERAGRETLRLLHAFETLAHGFYGDANRYLKAGVLIGAAASVYAAELMRERAHAIRSNTAAPDLPPAPEYPEAIRISGLHANTITREDFESGAPPPTTPEPGFTHVVVVNKPGDQRHNQIGEVMATGEPGSLIGSLVRVRFPDRCEDNFQQSELRWLKP